MTAANRRRGANAERSIVNHLRANGYPDARRYLAGDGRQPGDIDWHPLICLEVKDVANSSWPAWCRQAAAETRTGLVPAVVRRKRGVAEVGDWPVRVRAADDHRGFVSDWLGGGWSLARMPITGLWLSGTFDRLVAAVRAVDNGDAALNDELRRFATGRDA